VNNTIKPKELTIRGLILGALITTIFTAANVYLGLKVGLTFASSIPAAVISMAILSVVKDSSILENNIVQTVASAAGTLSAIIFVLPGLVIVGWWTGFPFWQSFLICLSGGVLGVLFTIPLRRALVTNSDLPYPEGVAAAEVLKVGSGTRGETKDETGEAREGLIAVILGSVASAGLAILTATRIAAASVTGFFRLGAAASSGYDIAFSLALVGAGHLVGLSVGMAMLTGLIIAWAIAVPILTSQQPAAEGVTLAAHTLGIWRTQVRFIGAGAIAIAAIYTLARLAKPVVGGLVTTLAASRATDTRDDRDHNTHGGMSSRRRLARIHICPLDCARAKRVDTHDHRCAFCSTRRISHCRHLRLHGRTHRRLEQSDFRCRHPLDRAVRVSAHPRCRTNSRNATGARRVCTLHHCNRLRLRNDLQRQSARLENRSTRRRLTNATTDRTNCRRRSRRFSDPVCA
jgi:uncharacterized oligopeptide transporter (OPT) family protein